MAISSGCASASCKAAFPFAAGQPEGLARRSGLPSKYRGEEYDLPNRESGSRHVRLPADGCIAELEEGELGTAQRFIT
jgi:hypothetical protein